MADNTIGKAVIQLIPSADGMGNAISGAMQSEGGSAGSSFGSSFLKGAVGVLATGATAVTGAVASLWTSANKTAQAGDEIAKGSTKLGVTAEQYQTLAFSAEHCDFSISNLETAQKSLMNSGFDGSVYDAINAIMSLDDAEERTAMATELFGAKTAMSMANLLQGGETLAEFQTELEGLGGVMSDEAVNASASFEDALTNVQTAGEGIVNSLMSTMLPGLTEVMSGIAGVLSGQEGADAIATEGISSIVDAFSELAPKLAGIITSIAPSLIRGGAELILALADGILQSLPSAIPSFLAVAQGLISTILEALPEFLELGINIITSLIDGLTSALPTLLPAIISGLISLITALVQNLPMLLTALLGFITTLVDVFFSEALPMFLEALPDLIVGIVDFIVGAIPQIINAVISIVMAIVENLPNIIMLLIQALPEIISAIIGGLISCIGELIAGLIQLVFMIVANLPTIITELIKAIPQIIIAIVKAIIECGPKFIEAGQKIIESLWSGIQTLVTQIANSRIGQKIASIVSAIANKARDFTNVGKNLISGLWNGISSAWSSLTSNVTNLASNLINSVKGIFGVHSPSVVFEKIGGFITEGFSIGMEDFGQEDLKNVDAQINAITSDAEGYSGSRTVAQPEESKVYDLLSKYLPELAESGNTSVTLEGDAVGLFKMVRQQNNTFKKSTGISAFV